MSRADGKFIWIHFFSCILCIHPGSGLTGGEDFVVSRWASADTVAAEVVKTESLQSINCKATGVLCSPQCLWLKPEIFASVRAVMAWIIMRWHLIYISFYPLSVWKTTGNLLTVDTFKTLLCFTDTTSGRQMFRDSDSRCPVSCVPSTHPVPLLPHHPSMWTVCGPGAQ